MSNRITNGGILRKAFGTTEEGLADLPHTIKGTRLARVFAESRGERGYCFPHGYDQPNSRWDKDLRCWKRYRKTQYRAR